MFRSTIRTGVLSIAALAMTATLALAQNHTSKPFSGATPLAVGVHTVGPERFDQKGFGCGGFAGSGKGGGVKGEDGALVAGELMKAGHRLLLDPVAVRQPKRLAVKREALFDAEFADQRLLVAHQLVMVAPARSLEIGGVRLGRQDPGQRLAARVGRHRQPGGSADLQIVKQRPVDELGERRVGREIGPRIKARVGLMAKPFALLGIMGERVPLGGESRHPSAPVIGREEHRVRAAPLGFSARHVMGQRIDRRGA